MVEVLLLTRGGLADEWLRATEAVRGCPAEGIQALCLDWDGTCDSDRAHVRRTILAMRQRGPVIVLTDLHGSAQSNMAGELASDPEVSIIAGANLAMVLRLACEPRTDRSVGELADWICAKGRAAITQVEPNESNGP